MDTRLRKWIRWLDIIQKEIYQLVIYRDIFWSVQELIKNNKGIQKPSIFYRFLSDSYVEIWGQGLISDYRLIIFGLFLGRTKLCDCIYRKYNDKMVLFCA